MGGGEITLIGMGGVRIPWGTLAGVLGSGAGLRDLGLLPGG